MPYFPEDGEEVVTEEETTPGLSRIEGAGGGYTRHSRPELEFLSIPDLPQELKERIEDYLPFIEKMPGFANLSPIAKARAENALVRAGLYYKVGMENLAAQATVEFLHQMQASRGVDMQYLTLLLTSKSEQRIEQTLEERRSKRKQGFWSGIFGGKK